MKSISLQYQDLKEGKMDKYQFLRNARMMFPNHVTNHNSFEDSVKILKTRGLLNEGDAVKGTPDKDPSYESPTPNADVKYKKVEQSPEVDEQDGIYPATTVKDIPKLKTSKKVKDKSDGLEPIKDHDTKNEMKKVKVAKATEQTLKESKKRLTERDNSDAQMAWEESISDELADMFRAGKISQKEHDAAQDYLETHGYDLYDPYEGNNDVEYILAQSKIVNLKEAIKRMVNEVLAEFKSQSKKKLTEARNSQSVELSGLEIEFGGHNYIVNGTADVIGHYEEPNYVDGYTESPGGWQIEDIELNLDDALKLDPSVKYDEGVEITSPEELKKLEIAIYRDKNAFNALYDYIDSSLDYDKFD